MADHTEYHEGAGPWARETQNNRFHSTKTVLCIALPSDSLHSLCRSGRPVAPGVKFL